MPVRASPPERPLQERAHGLLDLEDDVPRALADRLRGARGVVGGGLLGGGLLLGGGFARLLDDCVGARLGGVDDALCLGVGLLHAVAVYLL